jgi:dipeptidyl aminopeptidase/acylaminoacyl peptidase
VKAKTFTKLFYRHWVEYVGDKRQHLFVCDADGKNCRDVTPGDRDANPTSSTFDSGDNFTFTPDSKHIVFTSPPAENEAWSTNYDLCRVSIANPSTKWEILTKDNKAADSGPKFSPDGKKLAWRAQKRVGYEADKWDIVFAECKADGVIASEPKNVTEKKDISVNEFCFAGNRLFLFTADVGGSTALHEIDLEGKFLETGGINLSELPGVNGSLSCTADGRAGAFTHTRLWKPAELVTFRPERMVTFIDLVTKTNEKLFAELDTAGTESKEVPVEGDVKMHVWVIKPPGFDEKKKWPVVYLVHGGPQSAWKDSWSYRWNPKLWAAQGYVVVMPNPRGSVGFGQKFVDEITGDWGGKCYRDLVAGLDYVEKLPYVDKDRIAAAGGSFGGYMMNWFAVNDISPRFKCLVTHCSVWNFESMWGTTDELWFDEWEHGGLPWEKPHKYAEFSPHKKAGNLGKYKTPMLIIHNDLDFRCPIGQGHELFSALQRQGVPSRFVNFPDEGHWVLKPRNSEHWHKEIFAWLKKYAPPGGK